MTRIPLGWAFTTLFVLIGKLDCSILLRRFGTHTRDNMIIQQYDWARFKPTSAETDGTGATVSVYNYDKKLNDDGSGETCIGQECCRDGHTWVAQPINKCYPNNKLTPRDSCCFWFSR